MTTVETIPAPGTAAGADIEPIESASTQADWRARYPARAVETRSGRPSVAIVVRWIGSSPPRRPNCRRSGCGKPAAGVCRCCWTGSPTSPAIPGSSGGWPAAPMQRAKTGHRAGRWLRRRGNDSEHRLELMTSSLLVVVGADVVRPSLAWLLTGGKKRKLVRNMIYGRDRAGFERLRHLCEKDPAIGPYPLGDILFRCAVIVAAKGGTLADITVGDVLEILDTECAVRGRADSGSATFRMLREAGVLGADTPTLRADPQSWPAFARPTRRPVSDRVPSDPGSARGLLGRAATGDRLHHSGQSGLSPGAVFLVRRRAAPSRHRLAAVAT